MVTIKNALLLCMLSAAQGASFLTLEKKSGNGGKRAVDTYNYPLPVLSFPDTNPKKIYVETIKSLTSGQRYLPPTGPTISTAPALKPISVSFNAYEAPNQSPSPQANPGPKVTATPVATAPAAAASVTATSTPVRKRPSGGLGGFKYYGGSGSSASSGGVKTENSAAAASPASTSAPAAPAPVVISKPVQEQTGRPADNPALKSAPKNPGYDYPSPKSGRKPSKKEQKLADSKPEESGVSFYDLGISSYGPPGVGGSGVLSNGLSGGFGSGGVSGSFGSGGSGGGGGGGVVSGSFDSGLSVSSGSSVSGSAGGMGASYMRQSSPFYSYHVMLD